MWQFLYVVYLDVLIFVDLIMGVLHVRCVCEHIHKHACMHIYIYISYRTNYKIIDNKKFLLRWKLAVGAMK